MLISVNPLSVVLLPFLLQQSLLEWNRDLPSFGTGLRGGSLLGYIVSGVSVYVDRLYDLPLLLT